MTRPESHGVGPPPDLLEILEELEEREPDEGQDSDNPYSAVVTRARRIAARLEEAS